MIRSAHSSEELHHADETLSLHFDEVSETFQIREDELNEQQCEGDERV